MAIKIAVTNHKGGVGKTMTTFNLGAALAELGEKVLLIDSDGQCNLTMQSGANVEGASNLSTYLNDDDVEIKPVSINENLWIIPGSTALDEDAHNIELSIEDDINGATHYLADILKKIENSYSYILIGIDNTVNKLTADQLNVIYANMDSLKAVAANAANTIKGTTDANVALKAANDAVASMNSMLSAAGIVISNPTLDTSDSSQFVVSADVTVNGTTDFCAIARPLSTTTTDNNTSASDAVSNAAQNSAAASSVKTVSSAANPITASSGAVIKATGDNTAVVFAVAALAVVGMLGMAVRKERAL